MQGEGTENVGTRGVHCKKTGFEGHLLIGFFGFAWLTMAGEKLIGFAGRHFAEVLKYFYIQNNVTSRCGSVG